MNNKEAVWKLVLSMVADIRKFDELIGKSDELSIMMEKED